MSTLGSVPLVELLSRCWRSDPSDLVTEAVGGDAGRVAFLAFAASERQAWRVDAACIGAPLDMFFPRRGESPRPALRICAGCTVRDECLEDALRYPVRDEAGVRGGMTAQARVKLRRSAARVKPGPVCPECDRQLDDERQIDRHLRFAHDRRRG